MSLEVLLKEFEVEEREQPEVCLGLFYRYSRDCWIGSDGDVNFRLRFRPLRRRSCPGCDQCDWLHDQLHEDLCELSQDGFSSTYDPEAKEFQIGGVYQYKVVAVGRDWETGYVDDIDLGFVLVEREES